MPTARRTGFQVKDLPWRFIRNSTFTFRRLFGTVSVPEQQHIIAHVSVDELRDILRMNHYREGWFLSYRYEGEDANLCRAEYESGDGYNDYQHHIRVFDDGERKSRLYPHYELDPIVHPRQHIKEVNYSVSKGMMILSKVLKDEGVPFDVIEP